MVYRKISTHASYLYVSLHSVENTFGCGWINSIICVIVAAGNRVYQQRADLIFSRPVVLTEHYIDIDVDVGL